MSRLKELVVAEICGEIGIAPIPLGPGSKEKKAVFEEVDFRLGLGLAPGTKPELARRIAEAGAIAWTRECESTGDTITLLGLERVLAAVRRLKRSEADIVDVDVPGPIGRPYAHATGGIAAAPAVLLQDWDALDRATTEHADLQNAVARTLADRGLVPVSPTRRDPPFDVGWWLPERFVVCEIKSATPTNVLHQARLGLGQVLEYRYRLQASLHARVQALIVTSIAAPATLRRACAAVGVLIADSENLGALIDDLAAASTDAGRRSISD